MGWVVEADFFFQVERAQKNPSEPFEPVRLTSVENLPQNPKAIRQWQHTKNKHLAEKALHGKTKSIRKEALKNIHRIVRNLVPKEPSEAIAGKPTAWNQGGYDAFFVQYVGGRAGEDPAWVQGHIHLRFVQVTKGNSHDLKLSYFNSVVVCFSLAGYEVDSVEIGFMLTKFNVQNFKCGGIIGESLLKETIIFGSSDEKWVKVTEEKIARYELRLSKSLK